MDNEHVLKVDNSEEYFTEIISALETISNEVFPSAVVGAIAMAQKTKRIELKGRTPNELCKGMVVEMNRNVYFAGPPRTVVVLREHPWTARTGGDWTIPVLPLSSIPGPVHEDEAAIGTAEPASWGYAVGQFWNIKHWPAHVFAGARINQMVSPVALNWIERLMEESEFPVAERSQEWTDASSPEWGGDAIELAHRYYLFEKSRDAVLNVIAAELIRKN